MKSKIYVCFDCLMLPNFEGTNTKQRKKINAFFETEEEIKSTQDAYEYICNIDKTYFIHIRSIHIILDFEILSINEKPKKIK